MAGAVIGLEQDRDLAAAATENLRGSSNAEIVSGRLNEGLAARAPFDVIFLNSAVEDTPDALLRQLSDGGRLVCIVREGPAGHARVYLKHAGAVGERSAFDATVPVLPGFEKTRSFAF
jgi:protein-L-isoaspartate(D-aspartate) O-methyltransferase